MGSVFIDRPVFAAVLSVILTIVGAIAYFALPVSEYPEIAPPTVNITASYPGASAETVAETVAAPIEQEINGVDGMLYVVSQSTGDGVVSINVVFRQGTNVDDAQVLVQNRVSVAEPRLPEAVRRLGVVVRKSSPDLMMVVHMVSPDGDFDQQYVSNYATLFVRDRLARIPGVGNVVVFGARDYAMRVWLDPGKVAARNLTAGEVVDSLRAANVQVAAGAVNQPPGATLGAYQLAVQTQGRLTAPEEFGAIIVQTDGQGRVTRLRDVARVELGSQDYALNAYLNNAPATAVVIFQQPGSNALETAAAVLDEMDALSTRFPPGLEHAVVYNPTEFIADSIDAVIETFIEAILLVVLVILLFLQSWRAAIIPLLAIPVSIIATFAVMAAMGFSVNVLTMFGLILAIGIVVDDAIVVVENVERYLDLGYSPKEATRRTMKEVGGALIATSLVLLAVFLPVAFITGLSGQFYQQFAVTIAVSTVFSTFVSLTLSPAMAAAFLRRKSEAAPKNAILAKGLAPLNAFFRAFNAGFARLSSGYSAFTRKSVRLGAIMLTLYGGLIFLTWDRIASTPQGLIPELDRGYFITAWQLPPGSTLDRTDAVIRTASERILETPGVKSAVAFAGFDGATFTNAPNAGVIFVTLADFEERAALGVSADQIFGMLWGVAGQIPEAFGLIIKPPPVPGIGTGGGVKLYVQDRSGAGAVALQQATQAAMGAVNGLPEIQQAFTLFNTGTPQIFADVNRTKAEMLGVPVGRVNETLSIYMGSSFVNDFNILGRTYRVTAQADNPFRLTERDVANLRTRNVDGDMVPIGSVATFEQASGPYRQPRYNLFPAAELQAQAPPGVSTGVAIAAIEATLDEILPAGMGYEWTEIALQEKLAGDTAVIAFVLAVVFVYLVLAAMYESLLLPLSVILIVPMCILSALVGVNLMGLDNNILVQVGLVVLIGLAAKNAILIVEFARQGETEGMTRFDAAYAAAKTRLRPIIMTSLAFILGVVPLVLATGAGAEMRQSMGVAVFFGMLGVTGFGLIFTPLFYVLIRGLSERLGGRRAAEPPS